MFICTLPSLFFGNVEAHRLELWPPSCAHALGQALSKFNPFCAPRDAPRLGFRPADRSSPPRKNNQFCATKWDPRSSAQNYFPLQSRQLAAYCRQEAPPAARQQCGATYIRE
jgi:hypothetical protein